MAAKQRHSRPTCPCSVFSFEQDQVLHGCAIPLLQMSWYVYANFFRFRCPSKIYSVANFVFANTLFFFSVSRFYSVCALCMHVNWARIFSCLYPTQAHPGTTALRTIGVLDGYVIHAFSWGKRLFRLFFLVTIALVCSMTQPTISYTT